MSTNPQTISQKASAALNSAIYGVPPVLANAQAGDGLRKTDAGFELVPAEQVSGMAQVFDGNPDGRVLSEGRMFEAAADRAAGN